VASISAAFLAFLAAIGEGTAFDIAALHLCMLSTEADMGGIQDVKDARRAEWISRYKKARTRRASCCSKTFENIVEQDLVATQSFELMRQVAVFK